jgi:hypothetical protein
MAKYLLDTNVLLALAWPSHEFHEAAHSWWTHSRKRWATCALTENLPDSDIDVGVYTMKSGSAADPSQPTVTPNRHLPGFSCLHRWLFNHLCLFLRTSPTAGRRLQVWLERCR